MICNLCNRQFDVDEARRSCSASCGFSKRCGGARCPYCYYEMVPEPKWIRNLFSFLKREERSKTIIQDNGVVALSSLKANVRAEIIHLNTEDRHTLQKILAIGALPGMEITLVQNFPSYVFQIGRSQFSVDRELASCIHVRSIVIE